MGGHYGVPHGVANAILLTRVMDFNKVACPERFADVAAALGEDIDGLSPMEAADVAVDAVKTLAAEVGIPETLTDVGVAPEGIPVLAEGRDEERECPDQPAPHHAEGRHCALRSRYVNFRRIRSTAAAPCNEIFC